MWSHLNIKYYSSRWYYNKLLGITYFSQNERKKDVASLPEEIRNPFIVHIRTTSINRVPIRLLEKCYVYLLLWAARRCYPIVYILSHLRLDIYDNAQQASWAFQQITKGKQQKLLCLPRSIFVATTSKRFRKYGTLYIGVFLPSRNLHAWVIEDNMQTDGWDNYWILYQPLIMMRG